MNHCPNCGSHNGVKEIIYGLPSQPINDDDYVLGGCCITDSDPTKVCRECDFEWDFVNHLTSAN
jgi:hypothetical protein